MPNYWNIGSFCLYRNFISTFGIEDGMVAENVVLLHREVYYEAPVERGMPQIVALGWENKV